MLSLDPERSGLPATPVPHPDSPYWPFYEAVAVAQIAAWAPKRPARILDLSGAGPRRAIQLRDAGHQVVRLGAERVPGVASVLADARGLDWLADCSFDGVLAESKVLSLCLATEETARDLARVLRPGGRLLLVVDSLLTGLARLADQGRWAELADIPAAECVLIPDQDGTITRCFWPEELGALLLESGFDLEWVRPRTVLSPAAVERAVENGGDLALRTLVATELALARRREGETTGIHLVASARRPRTPVG